VTSPQLVTVRRRLADLQHYPGNARRGDVEAIRDSLRVNGQFRPLAVQASTDCVLTGNHTLDGMLAEGWEEADCIVLDVDDDAARRIVLADNRTSDLGGYDERALLALLREVGEELSGTGFVTEDYDDLLASLEEADALDPPQPTGAPAGAGGAYGPESDGGNVRKTPSYAEYEEQYSSRATRFMALNYPLAQYAWIVGHLSKISDEEGVDNFAEAVLRLVEVRTGETAPPLEDGQVIGGPPSSATVELEEAPSGG
jgi:hypothetical protein